MEIIKSNIHWVLRIYLAYVFISHGYPKLGNEINNMGIIGYLVGPFEFFGALFLLLGSFTKDFITKLGGCMISIIMIGAIYLHLFKWGDGILDVSWQIFLLTISLIFLIRGNKIFE